MKKMVVRGCLWLTMVIFAHSSIAGGFVEKIEQVSKKFKPGEQLFVGIIEEKKKQRADVEKRKEELNKAEAKFLASIQEQIDGVNTQIQLTKKDLSQQPEDEFLNKKLFILNETYQILQDVQRAREQLHTLLNNFSTQLTDFLDDPDFDAFKKENKLVDRLYYSFDDLQKIHEKMLAYEKQVAQLTEQEKNVRAELSGRKRTAADTLEQIKKKQQELDVTKGVQPDDSRLAIEVDHGNELLRAEEQLYTSKKMLDMFRLQETEYKIDFLTLQLFIAKSESNLVRDYLRKIKPSVRISEADVAYAKDELAKWKQEYYKRKEKYRQQAEKLREEKKTREQQVTQLSKDRNVSLGRELDEWTKEPTQTVSAYVSFCEVGAANAGLLALRKNIELLEMHVALEDEKLRYETLQIQVKESYHKISTRKIVSDEEIAKESKKYDAPKAEVKTKGLRYKEKIAQLGDLLSTQKRVLDHIAQQRKDLQALKTTVFKSSPKEYIRCLELLNQAEQYVKDQIDLLSKLTGAYSGVIAVIIDSELLINFIKGELEAITIWHRPEYAITWQGVQNIIADIGTFLSDIRAYIIRFDVGSFLSHVTESFKKPLSLFILFLKLFGLTALLLLSRRYLVQIITMLLRVSQEYAGLMRFVSLVFVLLLSFLREHFLGFMIWLVVFFFLRSNLILDPYLYALFYLCSIPYLLYFSYRFIRFLMHFNVQHDYALFAQDFQRRFIFVISTLLYATVVISLFREAFMLANYYKSELPTILLAVNFIIFQISLIFLISKEQILNLIPTRNRTWQWIRSQVDQYYYLLLLMIVAIIIMSNPYVGFGRLVLHILFGLIYTGLLFIGLIWVHALFKRIASHVFFSTEQEIVRERFANAKTWFGLLIIAAFVLFTFLGIIIGARIWGWQFNIADIATLLNEPLIGRGTTNPITAFSFLQIIAFVLAGFIISYALSRFVLDKIFDLLLVDTGVQHTVTSIMQYIVITVAVFIGFQSVGLGQLVGFIIGALAFSLGWVLKEPIGDFVAYFIILVQRPIKIGDYIKINEELQGVVRKITARSIVLRKKNSLMIVIPNSEVTTKALINWNYARTFIAFDDIIVTINYKVDPIYVKELLGEVVNAHSNVLKNPPAIVRLSNFGEYGYVFMVRGYISAVYTLEQWNIASDIRLAIAKKLRENNIEIAVPVRIIKSNKEDKEDIKTSTKSGS